MEFICFVFLFSNFRLHDRDRVTCLVYTQVLGMGISLSVFARFRLLARMTGDLVDLYPREKNGSECVVWKGRGRIWADRLDTTESPEVY